MRLFASTSGNLRTAGRELYSARFPIGEIRLDLAVGHGSTWRTETLP